MKNFDFNRLFDNSTTAKISKKRKRSRTCRIEELENREMLDADLFNAIQAAYGDLGLGNDPEQYNYIEIQAENLSNSALREAINEARGTAEGDIIVLYTTAGQNVIPLDSTALALDIDAEEFGSVTIVSLGEGFLTLDAGNASGVVSVGAATTAGLGGLILTNGNADNGGGIYNDGTLTVSRSMILDNTATYEGGGIFNDADGTLVMTNSLVAGNSVVNGGGGILVNGGTVTLRNCTITGNESSDASGGGGIVVQDGGRLDIGNTIIAQNADIDMQFSGTGGAIVGTYNLSSFYTPNPVAPNPLNVFYDPDLPLFVDAENGDYRLAPNSQAINRGSNAYVTLSGLTNDLDGNARIVATTVDIGAYEYQSGSEPGERETPSTIVTTLDDVVNDQDGLISLREAIAYAGTEGLGSTITFAESLYNETITLGGTELLINKNLTIDGSGANIFVDANGQSRVFNIAAGSTVTLIGLTISGGQATITGDDFLNTGGGGIWNAGTLTVTECTVSGNTAGTSGDGGGIHNSPDGVLVVANSIIAGNIANRGGGIYFNSRESSDIISGGSGSVHVENTLIIGNRATNTSYLWGGGGIYSWASTMSTTTVTNCTIVGNYSHYGPGIYNDGNLVINNTILAHNVSDLNNADIYLDVQGVTGNNNLVSTGDDIGSVTNPSVIADGVNGNIVGTTANPIDPLFVSFTPYASSATWNSDLWRAWDLHLTANSPAIDAGNNALVSGTTDLDGNPRIVGVAVDMGAYEFGEPTVYLDAPVLQIPVVVNGTTLSLTWSRIDGAAYYQLEYSTSMNFTAGTTQRVEQTAAGDVSAVVDNLMTNTTYYFRVVAVSETADIENSPPSNVVQGTPIITTVPLDAPTLAVPTVINATTLSVFWNRDANASSYRLEYSENANFTGLQTLVMPQPVGGTTVSVNLSGLNPNTMYYIRVVAVGDGVHYSDSTASNVVSARTLDLAGTDPVKPKVKANSKAATVSSVTLTWAPLNQNAEYVITSLTQGVTLSASQIEFIVTGGNIVGAVISDLDQGKRYRFSVLAKNAEGKETYTKRNGKEVFAATAVSARTQKYVAPKNIKVNKASISLESFSISWSPSKATKPSDVTERYEVEVWSANRKLQIFDTDSPNIAVTGTSATITGLEATTRYTVVVRAVASNGTESLVGRIKVSTAKYTAVSGVTALVDSNSVTLTWSPSQFSETNDYEIVRLIGRTEVPVTYTFTSSTSAIVTGLDSGQQYKFAVRAVVRDGVSGEIRYRSLNAVVSAETMGDVLV